MKKSSPTRTAKKRLILVDDHPIMRQGLAQLINRQEDLMVCREAGDAREAMLRVESENPDLAVVDISLDDKSGLELIKDLKALHPEVLVLVMSMHDELFYAERALRAGARGYVMKKAGGEAVLKAIRQVLCGNIYVSEEISKRTLKTLSPARSVRRHSPIEMLTDREFEVFQLMGEGCITSEIARRLNISPKTVEAHRQHLKEKLNLPSAASLIQHAICWVEARKGS